MVVAVEGEDLDGSEGGRQCSVKGTNAGEEGDARKNLLSRI